MGLRDYALIAWALISIAALGVLVAFGIREDGKARTLWKKARREGPGA